MKLAGKLLKTGADERTCTADLPITNRLLYQLSYVGLLSILTKAVVKGSLQSLVFSRQQVQSLI